MEGLQCRLADILRRTPASVAACLTSTSRPQGGLPPASGAYGRPGLCTQCVNSNSSSTHVGVVSPANRLHCWS
jgi:hypothetical protein